MVIPENRGGLRPTAPQNNPANVNALGGNGTSGDYTGFAYSVNKQLNESRVAGNAAIKAMSGPTDVQEQQLPNITGILDETQNPEQSIMHGAPRGTGPNYVAGLPQNPSEDPDIDMIRQQYPILKVWASMPGTTRATAQYVNYLGQFLGEE